MRILLPDEAAAILRVPKPRVYELVRQGKLPAFRVGRLVRISEHDLDEWVSRGGVTLDGLEGVFRAR